MSGRPVTILGLSAYYHDAAAALLADGEIVAAAQEERFSRVKGDASFPHRAIDECLSQADLDIDEIDHVVFYENPTLKFERLLASHHLTAPRSLRAFLEAMPSWITQKLWLERGIANELGSRRRVEFSEHHLSHAASAFFPSPFERAAILTVDGVGEWATASWGLGEGNRLRLLKELRFPNSVGLLYSAFTSFAGFKVNSGEYKLMGLAPYGAPVYAELIREKLVSIRSDGSIVLDPRYFDFVGGLAMTNRAFAQLFGGPPRVPEGPITRREMDLAASIQAVLDEILLKAAGHAREATGCDALCLAGGVALNGVSVGRILEQGIFERIWTQPAAGDAGGSLGAALWYWHHVLGRERVVRATDSMRGAFLGTEIPPTSPEDDRALAALGGVWEVLAEAPLQERIAREVAAGRIVGLARGRMEFGPRALGARSILADARAPDMQKRLNLRIKYREGFRPFAPVVLAEDASEYFDGPRDLPYMTLVVRVRDEHLRRLDERECALEGLEKLSVPRSDIPAVTHVDGSARVQTVDPVRNPFLHGVLREFKRSTGCPVMINTSFNLRGEPIVGDAADAFRCFLATEMDALVVGNRFFRREAQRGRAVGGGPRALD